MNQNNNIPTIPDALRGIPLHTKYTLIERLYKQSVVHTDAEVTYKYQIIDNVYVNKYNVGDSFSISELMMEVYCETR